MTRVPAASLPLLAHLGLAVMACGGPELSPSRAGSAGPLAGCQLEDDGAARTWMCGDLIAQELAADSATEVEARLVLDKFASDFVEARAVRTDVRWSVGSESFPSVRFEGTTTAGRRFTAQMVVISRPGDARVVQCASNSPTAPCEPVLDHLVRATPAGSAP